MSDIQTETLVIKKNSSKAWLGFIVILVLLLSSVLVLYWFNNQKIQSLSQQLRANENKLSQLEQLTGNVQQNANLVQKIVVQQQQFLKDLRSNSRRIDQNWILRESEYLTRLAAFSLQFEQNPQVAITLLQTADHYLASLNDPGLIPLRQSLANDITALQAVPAASVENILLTLNALSEQIPQLPIIATPEETPNTPKKEKHHHHQPGWKRNLQETFKQLRNVIVVQYHNKPVDELIAPENRNYLDLHLQMLLMQAQWSVLNKKQALYQQSLQASYNWVKNYYVSTSPKTQALEDSLQKLLQNNIQPDLPNLTATLNLIAESMGSQTVKPASPAKTAEVNQGDNT